MSWEVRVIQEPELRDLYEKQMTRDFPPDELRPYQGILPLLHSGNYLVLGLYEEDVLGAYACFALGDGLALLDYYAVEDDRRGTGVGSRFLEEIRKSGDLLKAPYLLLEVERPDRSENPEELEIREKRIRFYERNHCQMTPVCSRLFGVDYHVMALSLGEALPPEQEVASSLDTLYQILITPLISSEEERKTVCRVWTE